MAETMLVAFGRYLRTLRERRGYSLDDVASLTRLSPDPILKGYLSRCENGKTRIGFSKMNTLCQVYEIPLDVVAERHSLDMELEKIGGPDTKGRSFEDLVTCAATAFKQGRRWDAYAEMRDALELATRAPVMSGFLDTKEQFSCTVMNVASMSAALGKPNLARYEFEWIRSREFMSTAYQPILLERLATRYLYDGDTPRAKKLSDEAIAVAESVECHPHLAYLYSNRALIASFDADPTLSIELYQKAFQGFKIAGRHPECANTLVNLAQNYFDIRRLRAARRALASAEKLALNVRHEGVRARVRLLLGEIEDAEGRDDEAAARWHDAIEIAKRVNDKVLRFKAEYKLLEQAVRKGNSTLVGSLARRLARLAPWVPTHVEELRSFRDFVAAGEPRRPLRVSGLQRRTRSRHNKTRSAPLN